MALPGYERLPTRAQELALTLAGFQRARQRFTPYFKRVLTDWEELAAGPLEKRLAYQRDRLVVALTHARANVPHYRDADLPPSRETDDPEADLKALLSTLPVLEKDEVREAPGSFLARGLPQRRLLHGQTSGTTGTAIPLAYTPEAMAEEWATVWRLRRQLDVAIRDPHFTFAGHLVVPYGDTSPPFWRRNHWAHQTLFSVHHLSEEFLPHYVEAVHRLPARYVVGYPSALHRLARALLDANRPLPAGRLHGVFCSSESLLAHHRGDLAAAFGAPVRDRYGSAEFATSMVECSKGRLHVDLEFGIVEVEVREQGPSWERGPLLVTGLANRAMPFFRYRIGDIGTRRLDPCPCGQPGETFENIDGRIEDEVVTPDGRFVGRLDHIFKNTRAIAEAQVLQVNRKTLQVDVVPRAAWDSASERSLIDGLRARTGPEMDIQIRTVREIPREENGKFRAVKSLLPKARM